MENYVIYHLHSMLSNLTAGTGADSITKFDDYLDLAQQFGMSSIAFSEHGSVMNWVKKKQETESRGLKYIHANEIYLTKGVKYSYPKIEEEFDTVSELESFISNREDVVFDRSKVKLVRERDNYHFMTIAKNEAGVKELNKLTSQSFDKTNGHNYYNPRFLFDELKSTSDNIIMTSACLASPIWRLYNNAYEKVNGVIRIKDQRLHEEYEDLMQFFVNNKHRMFFEVQYHTHPEQIKFNQMLYELSKDTGIPLIAGTDTHCLNQQHAKGRQILLDSKGASYGDEDKFDLTMKSYPELVEMFEKQGALSRNVYLEAIHNTNVMADMIEEFELDYSPKYPKLFDEPEVKFKQRINEGFVERGLTSLPKEEKKVYMERIHEEFNTYKKLDAVDYMLLQDNIIQWCHKNRIYQGYGRGSVNGSLIAYLLKVTEMDSIKHQLNFSRFMNAERVSLADIDIDFPPSRRQEVIDYIASLEDEYKGKIYFAEIVTFNTIAEKGTIRDVGRALKMPNDVINEIAKSVDYGQSDKYRSKHPELFEYVDLLSGTIKSMGSHPSGFIVSPMPLDDSISTIYTEKSKYPVTAINMKELDGLNFVKLDVLGLDNIELINDTCEAANIERLTPDNVDVNDVEVWKSLTESTVGVFQFESSTAYDYVQKLFSDESLSKIRSNIGEIDYVNLLSMANGAIRPAGESYRNLLSNGQVNDNGHEALNNLLKSNLGYCIEENQLISTINGYKKIKDISIGDEVYTKVGLRKVLNKKYMGNKQTQRLTLSNGRSVIATPDHKVFTSNGWKAMEDISKDDTIAYLTGSSSEKNFNKSTLTIIAYLIGDGGLTTANYINFTNADIDVVNKYVDCVNELYEDLDVSVVDVKSRVNKLPLYRCRIRGKNGKLQAKDNGLLHMLRDLGLKFEEGGGCHSNDKYIPQFVFSLSEDSMASFLGAFFDTDGSITEKGDIRFKTSSKQLAYDIQELGRLLGFSFTVTENSSKSYDITTNDSGLLYNKIKDNSVLLTKRHEKLASVISKKRTNNVSNCVSVKLCKEMLEGILAKTGETYFALFNRYGFKRGISTAIKNENRKTISINTLKVFRDEVDAKYNYLFNENIKWLKVKDIENHTLSDVYDLEIEGEHNFTANGIVVHNCIFQEDIIRFLTEFCNHTGSEADNVRRGFAKKTGTEQFLPKIREGFIKTMKEKYNTDQEEADKVLMQFLKVIEDASDYLFSANHSQPYSYIGYIGAYLRHYYPKEFIASALNIFEDKKEKSASVIGYAKSKGISIEPIKFGRSKAKYVHSKEDGKIYKGLKSISYMNDKVADELYDLSINNCYLNFIGLLEDIATKTSVNTNQTKILIRLGFFSDFGNSKYLEMIMNKFHDRFKKTHKFKTKLQRIAEVIEYEKEIKDVTDYHITDKVVFEKDTLGYAVSVDKKYDLSYAIITDVDTKYSPTLKIYLVNNGMEMDLKIQKNIFYDQNKEALINVGDLIKVKDVHKKPKMQKVEGKWVPTDVIQNWLASWLKVEVENN